jgi:hypothetical protein
LSTNAPADSADRFCRDGSQRRSQARVVVAKLSNGSGAMSTGRGRGLQKRSQQNERWNEFLSSSARPKESEFFRLLIADMRGQAFRRCFHLFR